MRHIFAAMAATIFTITALAQGGDKSFSSQSNEEFAKSLKIENIQLVDVRTPSEYREGHILGAQNIDVLKDDFSDKASKLNKSYPVAIYCRSGARSKNAAQILIDMGYTVFELDRGFMNWDRAE